MQKARRHPDYSRLRPLVSVWFQVLFTPFLRVLFTFPLQYWFTIGLSVVFSLTRWCWHIQTEFLRFRLTHLHCIFASCTGLSPPSVAFSNYVPLTLLQLKGSSAFARHYLRNNYCSLFLRVLRCFSSPGSLQPRG